MATGEVVTMKVKPHTTISTIRKHIEKTLWKEAGTIALKYDGQRLFCVDRICDIDWSESEDEPIHVEVHLELVGGKPVIYLFSPIEMDATVNLSLVPSWRFSAIYPVVPTKSSALSHETLAWRVRTHADGSLTEKNTGLDVAYLYWEAHTNSDAPPSPPPSPLPGQNASIEHFCPNSSDLYDHNAVVLPVASLTPYLDKALKSLGLHTEARTSFITYWLPSFLKHNHIALRFVPQASYERAAPLDISPAPAVSTRVFMLFKGVREENLDLWQEAQARANDDVAMWRDIVGVDIEKASDENSFRVLEWGGMEVLRG